MSSQEELGKHCVRLRRVLRRSLTPSQEVSHRRRQCWSNNLLFVMRENWKKLASSPCCFTFRHPVKLGLCQNHQSLLPGVCVCVSVCVYVCALYAVAIFFFYPQSYQSVHLIQSLNLPLFLHIHTRTHTHTLSLSMFSLPPCLPPSLLLLLLPRLTLPLPMAI